MSEVRRYIGIVAVRMLRVAELSSTVRVEATARVVTRTPCKSAKRGYDATFDTFSSGLSGKLDSSDDTRAGKELRDAKFQMQLRKLSKLLADNGFTSDEIADAINATNRFLTPVNPTAARRRGSPL